jgi:Ca2+-binding RTX toxin-like protein
LIPGVVGSVAAAGRNVRFVNVNGGLTTGDLLAGGVNLAASGHTKIGNLWYDALMDEDTLVGIENITGTAFSDIISGTNSNNRIEGGLGSDRLTGGTGADTFVYRSLAEGEDTITDFTAFDTIQISASGFGGGLVAGVSLANGTASATGTFVNGVSPIGTGPNFLYNNGFLRYDPDGTGAQAAVTIATLTGGPALTANRINIVA